MPTYEYLCRVCGNRIEVIHGMTEPGPSACESCGGPVRRVLHATGIIFKGSGFYKTDSRASSSASSPPAASSSSTGSSGASDGSASSSAPAESAKPAQADTSGTSPSGTPSKPSDAG